MRASTKDPSGPLRAIIFDFDYTLADSSSGVVECINYALGGLGLPAVSAAAACRTIGLTLADTLVALAGPEHAARADEFFRLFGQHADRVMTEATAVYLAVRPVAAQLKRGGLRLGIVSTKYRRRIEAVLRRDGLLDWFDVIVGWEDVSGHKPDPEGLLLAVDRLGVSPARALYVGDSLVDAETARRGGVPFLAVLSGVTTASEFASQGVTEVVGDIEGVCQWLNGASSKLGQ